MELSARSMPASPSICSSRNTMTNGTTSRSTSTRAIWTADIERPSAWRDDQAMIERVATLTGHALSRRRVVALGAGAAAAALAGIAPRRADAVLKLDVTSGNVQPIPIAIPDFVSVATQDPAAGRNVSQIIASNLQRSG